MPKDERDEKIRQIMGRLFKKAEKSGFTELPEAQENLLGTIFKTRAWGFREILLVITIAKLVDPSYSATNDFYGCNPRAIYEGPIRSELASRGIPRRKSGPLNIAKATKSIDGHWAAQREPKDAADAVVQLVKAIEKMNQKTLINFATRLHAKFLGEGGRVAKLVYSPTLKITRSNLIELSIDLINNVPDEGNTPQKICGELIRLDAAFNDENIEVLGAEDEACTTSTTSKKPGDVVVLRKGEKEPLKVYEISVKKIDENRLDDCVEAVSDYSKQNGAAIREVFFLCRAEDISLDSFKHKESDFFGTYIYEGIEFHFFDIFSWIKHKIADLPYKAASSFFSCLKDYVSNENRSESVKLFWRKWFMKK
jgi:hypothetical protein